MSAKHQVDDIRRAKRTATTRLGGHDLQWCGAPHTADKRRVNANPRDCSGDGRALCLCGAMSTPLPSANKRRAWHRQHKLDVIAERAS